MLNSMLDSLQILYGTNNYSVLLSTFTTVQLGFLHPLFIDASSTVLASFSKILTFTSVISSVAMIPASQCCLFSRFNRALFASYAAPYLVKESFKFFIN